MGKNKSIRIGQNENRSIKKVLEEIENKAIESQYTNRMHVLCLWSRLNHLTQWCDIDR